MKLKFKSNKPLRYGGYLLTPDKNLECELPKALNSNSIISDMKVRFGNAISVINNSVIISDEVIDEVTEEVIEEVKPEVTEEVIEEVKPEVTEEVIEEVKPEVTEEVIEEVKPEVTEEVIEEVKPSSNRKR